ncbi:hypothetical protein GY45DRAFT_1434397 [Cubamyces sp. BRFM 1775]|nr:hypothetical protein GY45DRAFT_1434397 [Cubamyces sp. BRFM 1775]
MSYECISCTRIFISAIALGAHQRQCRTREEHAAKHFNKRKAELDALAEEERKRQRTEVPAGDHQAESSGNAPAPSPPGLRSRTGRRIRAPRAWRDYEPTYHAALPTQIRDAFPRTPSPSPHPSPHSSPSSSSPSLRSAEDEVFETDPDAYGVYHQYQQAPQRQPAPPQSLRAVFDGPPAHPPPAVDPEGYPSIRWLGRSVAHTLPSSPHGPFESKSVYLLCEWFYNSSNTKSLDDLDELVRTLTTNGFKISDLVSFRARREMQRLDEYVNPSGIFSQDDGWQDGATELPLPKPGVKFASEVDAPVYTVEGLHFLRLLEVILSEVQDQRFAGERHYIPHKTFWNPPRDQREPHQTDAFSSPYGSRPPTPEPPEPVRIFSETYNSDAMNHAHAKLHDQPRNPDDPATLEYAILPILLWSDATLLAQFGGAKLWPIYLYIANITKYVRGMPTEFVAQHLAYIPELPDELQDFYRQQFGAAPTAETLRWLRVELMQQVWIKLLDDDFIHAYVHGIVVECGDGVVRRLFPRFFTYSADYPEKVLITAIKNLGTCPCPRCLIMKSQISASGTLVDDQRRAHKRVDTHPLRMDLQRARRWLFTRGYSLSSKRIRDLLGDCSLLPLQCAFSMRLGEADPEFNAYELVAPDLMHEFELGVWKGTFLHLMRLLHAQGSNAVQEFDRRMRNMPTFGRDTIRRFWNNVSRQNRLAARDFEDFLITALPAFEGLLPLRDDHTVQNMLFELVNWHALARLRMHTSVTLDIWRAATRHMYASEAEAKARRALKSRSSVKPTQRSREPKVVKYNVWNTYKYHCLGDHPDYVERSGTTDNYDTRVGELEHRHAKRVYTRTNKHQFERQIAKHQRRQAILRRIRADTYGGQLPHKKLRRRTQEGTREVAPDRKRTRVHPTTAPRSQAKNNDAESTPPANPASRYSMGHSQHRPINIYDWVAEHSDDPALTEFVPSLRRHLVARLSGTQEDDVEESWTDNLDIQDDRIYCHKAVQFNYPTYDMRRAQDSINPRTHADIMVLSGDDDDSPYWYARVVGAYHAVVRYTGPRSTGRHWQSIDMLWVRWFAHDSGYLAGFQHRRLPRLSFISTDDPDALAFSFINPSLVLRAAYILPSFAAGTTVELLPSDSVARQDGTEEDYEYYYVCSFVDRDMYMRHLGGGVGHQGIGVSLETSRSHSSRAVHRRRTPRVTLHVSGTISTSDSSEISHSDDSDSSQEDANEGSDAPARSLAASRSSSPDSHGDEHSSDGSELEEEDPWAWGPADEMYHIDAHWGFPDEHSTQDSGAGEDPGDPIDSNATQGAFDADTLFSSDSDANSSDFEADYPRL